MDLKRVTRGNPIRMSADVWNVVQDMVRDYLQAGATGARRLGLGAEPGVVMIKNVSDTDALQFGILGVHDILFSPDDNEQGFRERPALCATVPDADLHVGKFVVCLEPIASQEIGRALLVGVTPVKINILGEDHEFADIADEDLTRLESAATGSAQILYKESGIGEKWAVVRLGVPPGPFEYFARSGANFATVDEANPTTPGHGAILLYKDEFGDLSDERRLLIHSDHVYGRKRKATFYIDLAQVTDVAGDWLYAVANTFIAPPDPARHCFQISVRLRVRAITTDFDPATVTWNDAYGAAPTVTFDAHAATQLVAKVDESIWCVPNENTAYSLDTDGMPNSPRNLENVMLKCDVPEWNSLDAIYGFEVTLQLSATHGQIPRSGGAPWSEDFDEHWVSYPGTPASALSFAIRER